MLLDDCRSINGYCQSIHVIKWILFEIQMRFPTELVGNPRVKSNLYINIYVLTSTVSICLAITNEYWIIYGLCIIYNEAI